LSQFALGGTSLLHAPATQRAAANKIEHSRISFFHYDRIGVMSAAPNFQNLI
jgi:hypothetical protein